MSFAHVYTQTKDSRGQVLLIVVITMIVALTVGLSIASRTITNLKISSQTEESQRAFQAAEAGIEQALRSGGATLESELEDADAAFSTTIEEEEKTIVALNGGNVIDQSRGIDFFLAEYNEDPALLFQNPWSGSLRVYWGNNGQSCIETSGEDVPPAIELVIIYDTNGGDPKDSPNVVKYILDPCPGSQRVADASDVVAATTSTYASVPGQPAYIYRATIPSAVSRGLIMKVVPLFNSSRVAVESLASAPYNVFPPQGKLIESTGVSGDTERKIIYFQSYPQIPNEIFPYSIVSQ